MAVGPQIVSKCRNAGRKVGPASEFLPPINCVSPASAFRHWGQPRTLVTMGKNGIVKLWISVISLKRNKAVIKMFIKLRAGN